jgi:hypothetical protein
MAVSPVTIKTRVSYPEPQMLVEFDWYHGTHIIHADGTESWFYRDHVVVRLKKKVVVEEIRGFTSDPSANYANSSHASSFPVYGTGNELVGIYTYDDTVTTYECSRINEAGFWRVVKTTTTATPEVQVVS